ncbi:MAG: hypothetical protein JKY09_00515 [Crocinitomicaceae bacterium]|nr:hypothetical protein [Crocinitomicaceae bacterium]
MKQLLYLSLIGIILVACKKESLQGNTKIMEGKWKWISSTEVKWNYATDNFDVTEIPSSNYPDEYFLEFERRGKVKYFKNNEIDEEYRIVFDRFEQGCNELTMDCFRFHILLNNNKKNTLTGVANQDTIECNDTNLPVSEISEIHYYVHNYVHIN